MNRASNREVKPLKELSFAVIQEPLTGLWRNMDSDLQRRMKQVQASNDLEQYLQVMLLLIMLRFAINSYRSIAFLLSDLDEHPRRSAQFVLVVPPINRQIMDLWFNLVYILDEIGPRSIQYEQTAYRELRKMIDDSRSRYGSDPDWQPWFEDMQELADMMESQIPLTAEQKADPQKAIPSWPHPHALSEKRTKSQSFLQFLYELVYSDTSIETHLKASGLMVTAGILLADIAPEELRKNIEQRNIHQYNFRHYCRTVVILLGIVSEIENHCNLNNKEQASKIWQRLAEYNADAKDIYEIRYKTMLG